MRPISNVFMVSSDTGSQSRPPLNGLKSDCRASSLVLSSRWKPRIEPVTAADLGLVKRLLCPCEQGRGIVGIAGMKRDADAHRDDRGEALHDIRFSARFQEPCGLLERRRGIGHLDKGGEVVGLE